MSAGLMGAERVRRRREAGGREGDMECVWRLGIVSFCFLISRDLLAVGETLRK
jgi:hypothetical protein